MSNDVMQAALATWAARQLPARLDVAETSKLLGFAEHDVQILMAAGRLTPLGDPAPNAPKWFAAVEMIRLAADKDWLHKATKDISKYWRHKRERRQTSPPSSHFVHRRSVTLRIGKVSPKSSPEVSPNGHFGGNGEAMHSREQVFEKSA